jgi:hypothetical protein
MFRQSATGYRKAFDQTQPVPPNLLDDFLYRTAQWQKSVQGTNLTKITDIALAETETRVGDEENQYGGSTDAWGKE